MRNCVWIMLMALLVAPAIPAQSARQEQRSEPPPPWAYGYNAPADPAAGVPKPDPLAVPAPDDGRKRHLSGSTSSFTVTQIRDAYGPADWYPGDHPAMPEIVAHGKNPEVRACSLCHYPNGKGRPENAGIAGLPYEYIVEQIAEFRNGARSSADLRKPNTHFMIDFSRAMNDEETRAAARYFSSMAWTPWIKVIETETVPKTRIGGGMFLKLDDGGTEPIGDRIIETPVNAEATEVLRDARSGFIAYVPMGSIKKGEALVMKGGAGKTTACTICHAADLQGLGPVPGLAGRSPSYLVRQMYDIQHGFRTGSWTSLMKPVVANLTTDDMLSIAAFLASRGVPAAETGTVGSATVPQDANLSKAKK
ncbi:MAG TPA: c-type cytochrome [Bryobacteraceae bacterium]|nr:c-type cytochrome [Bryobacteraceae bacterium]